MSANTRIPEEALLVSPYADDHRVLGRMFEQQNWRLFRSATVTEALHLLRVNPVPLVISERDLLTDGWKELLFEIRDLPHAPLLVVMSDQADEFLWSEVLNLCGHDVLSKPLYPPEALRVFRHAFQRCSAPREGKRTIARRWVDCRFRTLFDTKCGRTIRRRHRWGAGATRKQDYSSS